MFSRLKNTARTKRAAASLLEAARAGARAPALFGPERAPDTIDGRFETMTLHVALYVDRLGRERGAGAAVAQALFDVFMRDLDGAVREMAVGDLTVPKKVRRMGEAFYGRLRAYREALEGDDDAALAAALARNVFGAEPPSEDFLGALTAYVRASHARLAAAPLDAFLEGDPPPWPAPPG
jgi:cytochrome b pre-mRNA-processing protein 3